MGDLIAGILVRLGKAIRRGVNVWRDAPEESHTAVEYADALLFPDPEEDSASLDPSRPLSIRNPN
jgi:hypothetical protein